MVPRTKCQRKPSKRYDVDKVMLAIAAHLIRDFRNCNNDPTYASSLLSKIQQGDIVGIRSAESTIDFQDSTPYLFKTGYQLESLFKRYRFRNDLYSDSELVDQAIAKFNKDQNRISNIDLTRLSAKTERVLSLASAYIAKTLGTYRDEEHRSSCRFGSRASVGIPARKACEAARWELPISGSLNQISWFDSEMSQIESVQNYWAAQRVATKKATYQEVDSLRLTLVPKTFKSLRSIMPNTTIGSYMSYGLGEMIRKRLKRVGYNIRTLQQRHKVLACSASKHSQLTTTDLSSASDSISVALVHRLFPPDWLEILELSRIGKVELPDGTCAESETFCTMGVGYTFPLQTLVFLSLLKAIELVFYGKRDRRTISVYGDDMIYSSRLHQHVVPIFSELGFVINLDKTFHEGNFRESCGGDYYHGVDVRPFQPRNGAASVGPKAYEAVLYKYANGLLARWSEYEICETLDFICQEIVHVTGCCKLVPRDFPDDSGIKVSGPCSLPDFLKRTCVAQPKKLGHGVYRFSFLRLVPEAREELRHGPYLWAALRGASGQDIAQYCPVGSPDLRTPFVKRVDAFLQISSYTSPFQIQKVKGKSPSNRKISRLLSRISTFVTVSHTGRYMRQSGTSCFGVP